MNIKEELFKHGLTVEKYENILNDCSKKVNRLSDSDWADICDKYNLGIHYDTLRKASSTIFGGSFVQQYYQDKLAKASTNNSDEYMKKLEEKEQSIRKEVIKLQTLNVERNRLDRAEARQELYYQFVGSVVESLPTPIFENSYIEDDEKEIEYVLTIADIHYGATFTSINNEYSVDVVKERFERLTNNVVNFVADKKINRLHIVTLGDTLQGILRLSDLKINDSSVVRATVDISRMIAKFLNDVSAYVSIDYYHSPTANHTQTRPLGSKAGELCDEDMEYIISHYIEDLCRDNERIKVHYDNDGQYLLMHINGFNIVATHGHTLKNLNDSLKQLSVLFKNDIDYLLCGHYHGSKQFVSHEGALHDCEILVSPSFIGSDPYSDSILKGSKGAVHIYGFDNLYGHTETYKLILQ